MEPLPHMGGVLTTPSTYFWSPIALIRLDLWDIFNYFKPLEKTTGLPPFPLKATLAGRRAEHQTSTTLKLGGEAPPGKVAPWTTARLPEFGRGEADSAAW